MQRVLDIVFSGLALLVLAPLLVPIAIALRLTGEGEVFYVQQRIGRGGRPFGLYKFATMLKDSPNMGTGTITLHEDPRVLPVGRFLRRTKFNELPQLFNVLRGEMSLVGPRPQTVRCFQAFPPDAQEAIMRVRPGLSGLGSIVFRDEEEMMNANADPEGLYDRVIMPYKGRLEQWYVAHRGLATYFKVIACTLWVVATGRVASVWRIFPGLPEPPEALATLRHPEP